MKGYLCDGCGAFDPGTDDQRDGSSPPRGWATVTGVVGIGPPKDITRHLCRECAGAAFRTAPMYQEMKA